METITGQDSGDLGSGNKDRVGFFGKLRRNVAMMLFHPAAFLGKIVSAPFNFVAGLVKGVFNKVSSLVSGVTKAIGGVLTGIKEAGKALFGAVLKIPGAIASVVKDLAQISKEFIVGLSPAGIRWVKTQQCQ